MKNSPYFKLIIFAILGFCLGFLIPNIPAFKNKKISDLEKENQNLHKNINARNEHISMLDSSFNKLNREKLLLENVITTRNGHINILEQRIDSINRLIETSDITILKIKKDGYEEINTINTWDINKRLNFFSDYFREYNSKP